MQFSELRPWITGQEADFTHALKSLVEINTFSDNLAGVDTAMNMLSEMAAGMGLSVESLNERHRLIKAGNGHGKRILLISHMDTVHPPDGDFLHWETQADGYVRAPGIGDMKGGLLMGLWTLLAMKQLCDDFDAQLVVSADEEKGSPTIQNWYNSGAGGAVYGLGLEPGFPQGALSYSTPMGYVYQRKGCGRLRFKIRGRAAHAGGAWQDGLSAVEGMAHRILKIHALTDTAKGITTNVGLVKGGTAANTTAEFCEASVDFRYYTQADAQALVEQIREIVETPTVYNKTHDQWDKSEEFVVELMMPAMEKTDESQLLVDLVLQEGQRLGHNLLPIARGGGSDANYTSGAGVPSICGMGAPAEGIHTTQERILLPMLFDRLELLVSTVFKLASMG